MTENIKDFLNEIDELKEYRNLGTIEEIQKMKKEEDILKFYYCKSEDEYYIGKRIDTMYYAKYSKTGFVWCMSRYLPWDEHVIVPNTLWKEHTYPSEPKEIPFFEWLQGFIKKQCLGTVEECREAKNRLNDKENYTKQILWERDIAIQQLEEIGISLGEKMDSIKEIMERKRAKKPYKFIDIYETEKNGCPNCYEQNDHNEILYAGQKYCSVCGQALYWED